MYKKLVIVQVAGLGHAFLRHHHGLSWKDIHFHPVTPVFPALTCTAQASFRTGLAPDAHGMVANGLYHRELRRPLFWEQSSALVAGPRFWEAFRARGKRVALLFWQQSLGESADIILSPAPIHKHGGGLVPSVYSQPAPLYTELCHTLGKTFPLFRYWGPLASAHSSEWIARATAALLVSRDHAPDLCLTYLPVLDYDLQRHGPDHPSARKALQALFTQLELIRSACDQAGYELLVWGDYAIGAVRQALFPNRLLHAAGLLRSRSIGEHLYPDFHASQAFAVVDHEIAHIYTRSHDADSPATTLAAVRAALAPLETTADILSPGDAGGVTHPNSGELLLVAKPGAWLAYPWWTEEEEAPDYASHVDIHNKPGYDPCELFFGWPPFSVGRNPGRIRGSHGHAGHDALAAWCTTLPDAPQEASLLDLTRFVRHHLETMR